MNNANNQTKRKSWLYPFCAIVCTIRRIAFKVLSKGTAFYFYIHINSKPTIFAYFQYAEIHQTCTSISAVQSGVHVRLISSTAYANIPYMLLRLLGLVKEYIALELLYAVIELVLQDCLNFCHTYVNEIFIQTTILTPSFLRSMLTCGNAYASSEHFWSEKTLTYPRMSSAAHSRQQPNYTHIARRSWLYTYSF